MSPAARLILVGLLLTLGAIAAFVGVDWTAALTRHPHYLAPLRATVGYVLNATWYWAFAVPVLIFLAAAWRMVVGRGTRLLTLWKVFAYFTLWAIGSVAFFFGLFLTWAPTIPDGGVELLVPGLAACLGYVVIGMGFVASVARN